MKTGRPDYHIPSAETVSRDVKKIFVRCRQRVSQMLQEYDGALNFATDAWTSLNHKAYVAITVHFEHDGAPVSLLLDLVEVAKSHSGVNLASAFANVLKDFGISDKILSITCDNASNNDAMIEELAKSLEAFPGAANLVSCSLHIVNLVAKGVLHQFEPPKSKKQGNDLFAEGAAELAALSINLEDDGGQLDDKVEDDVDDAVEDDDVEGLDETRDGMSADEIKELKKEVKPVQLVLAKLRKVAFTIKNSTTLALPEWNSTIKMLELRPQMMPRDVSTRWNSTYDMLEFAIQYRAAINSITGDQEMKMRELELTLEEWKIAEQLRDTLKVFKHTTLYFSRDTPSISAVIPAMDHIDEHLATAAENPRYLFTALPWSFTPVTYFERAGWQEDWIEAAQSIVHAEYDRTYAFMDTDNELIPEPVSTAGSDSENMFDALPALTAPPPTELHSELERYLNTDIEDVTDPIRWWYVRKTTYPRLHRMALDYLTIPATSVDVERVFSQGRLLLSHVRSRLSVQSTRALMCLGGWSLMGYVRDSDVKAVTILAEVPANTAEEELEVDWDAIVV
ncbi:hypothetical protein GALMADRAFT_146839 [Galerina marginata CBS 339.88]|uniref:HAT C-terminal dimerisation domain-containing protein n=1 Tax=Galerina marginata (strain CBS 339.88) TaxID=685588 RepID=A0A067SJB7_GALM3|nr:hypothetical protein GALMADRAFT_146839 [Galerina marginata CBS 339.88]